MNYFFKKNTLINFFVVIVKSETTTVFRILTYLFVKPVIFSDVGVSKIIVTLLLSPHKHVLEWGLLPRIQLSIFCQWSM